MVWFESIIQTALETHQIRIVDVALTVVWDRADSVANFMVASSEEIIASVTRLQETDPLSASKIGVAVLRICDYAEMWYKHLHTTVLYLREKLAGCGITSQ